MTSANSNPDRRGFVKKAAAVVIGAIAGMTPIFAGLGVLLDPLRRKGAETGFVQVATLDALPLGSSPRKFPVLANRVDAWNKYIRVPIGAVFLRRVDETTVQAFNVVCPHAGCYVDFLPERGAYLCPCHNSTFTAEGKIDDPSSPSPRGLDALQVEIRKGREVWVRFQNFQSGHPEKIPVA